LKQKALIEIKAESIDRDHEFQLACRRITFAAVQPAIRSDHTEQ
jgi:hypothetical protein